MRFPILYIGTMLIALCSTPLYAQSDINPFSLQLNTGYTYLAGKKLQNANSKFGLGSLTSGQIPIGIEMRYKLINKFVYNQRYLDRMSRWSNYFTDRLLLTAGYTAFVGIPYQYVQEGVNFKDTYKLNLHSHTLRVGAMYDFTNDLEKLFKADFKQVRTYFGIDLLLMLHQARYRYSETLDDSHPASEHDKQGITKSNLFANFGIMPKLEVTYYLPDYAFNKGRFSQWWYTHGFYINWAVQYTMIVPSKIKNFELPTGPLPQLSLNHSINFNIGIGFRF